MSLDLVLGLMTDDTVVVPGHGAVVGRAFVDYHRTVIGIAKAGKYRSVDEAPHPFFYLPYTQGAPELDLGFCVRLRTEPLASAEAIRDAVRTLDPGVDVWIKELRQRGVELNYTARPLSWKEEDYLSDEERLEYFATTDEVIGFPATGGWLENMSRLENSWYQHTKQLQEQAEERDPELRAARLKPTFQPWILGAWCAGMYALGAGYLLPYLVQNRTLPPGAWPLEILVVLPAAALFFLPLRRSLRWYHGLVCWLLLVVIAFAVVVGTVEMGPAAERMAMIGFGLTVLSAALLWALYLLVKRSAPRDELARSAGAS